MIKDNMSKLYKAVLLVMAVAYSASAFASGFGLYEYSARGNAMGGATMANKAEPASIATNPALITKLEGTQFQAGVTAVIVNGSTTVGTPLPGGTEQSRDLKTGAFYLPTFYLTQQISNDVFVGLGFFPRFGLGGEYENYKTWAPATQAGEAYKVDLMTYSFNPNIAVKLNDELSLAMGLEVMMLDFSESKYSGGPEMDIKGDSVTWGGNFGVLYNPSFAEKWAAALTYRTKTRHVASGSVTGPTAAYTGDAKAALTLPDQLAFGLSFTPSEKLTVEADIMGVFWSSYSQLRIDYDNLSQNPQGKGPYLNEYKNYKDSYRIGVGAEYSLNKTWDLRAGYVFDKSPINPDYMDTLVPADDRNIFSVGLGYTVNENLGVDFSYAYMLISDLTGQNVGKTNPVNGNPMTTSMKYEDASSHLIGISVKYKF